MERLPKDIKGMIAKNLNGTDILSLFKVIGEDPSSSSYNSLWISKIRKEFNTIYIGTEAFEEYKFLQRLRKRKIYNVVYVDRYADEENEDYEHDSWVESFVDRESALSFIIQEKIYEAAYERRKKYNISTDKELYTQISKEVRKVFETESHIPYNYGYLYINQNRFNKSHSHHFTSII